MTDRRHGFAQISNSLWKNDKATSLALDDPQAFSMWVMAIAYCSDNMTDGEVTGLALRRLLCPVEVADRLVDAGFFDRVGDHYRVHDYLDWQNSREDVERDAARHRDRQRRYMARQNDASHDGSADASMTPLKPKPKPKEKPNPFSFNSLSRKERDEEKKKNDDDSPVTMTSSWRPSKESLDWADHTWAGMDTELAAMQFTEYWNGKSKTPRQWDEKWRGWIINRASQRHLTARKPHTHTWACEHTLRVLRMDEDGASNHLKLAYRVANSLNKGMGEEECRRRLLAREAVS